MADTCGRKSRPEKGNIMFRVPRIIPKLFTDSVV